MVVLGCVLWNLLAFFTFAKRMFPNFWCASPLCLCLGRFVCVSVCLYLCVFVCLSVGVIPYMHTHMYKHSSMSHTPPPTQRYARGVTLMGDALGHSWVGLLLARAIDPQLQTPVPLAFTYKLLVRLACLVAFRRPGW